MLGFSTQAFYSLVAGLAAADLLNLDVPTAQRLVRHRLDDATLPAA